MKVGFAARHDRVEAGGARAGNRQRQVFLPGLRRERAHDFIPPAGEFAGESPGRFGLPEVLGKPVQQQLVVLGSMSLGGNIVPVENLAESLQVAFDSGAKRILLPMASVKDIPTVPGELFAKFQTSFYADPTDAVFKALGVS